VEARGEFVNTARTIPAVHAAKEMTEMTEVAAGYGIMR
jgi:hypothetical protein